MSVVRKETGAANGRGLPLLVLGALGVVYGDIGTSPLYAVRLCFSETYSIPPTQENILGVLSLIFWALTIIISVGYVGFIVRADNKGEGGILALMALALRRVLPTSQGKRFAILTMGLFGAALLYGDAMITPAICVLSAVEGLEVATSFFSPYILPITAVILVVLFSIQPYGTGRIGVVFGPVILIWFISIGLLGLISIIEEPHVLLALNPFTGLLFFLHHKAEAFLILGAVFLVVTGGESLYADMGHVGKKPIRYGWYFVAMPGLLLNYFGQGAMIISNPAAISNPFFALAPRWGLIPLVLLSTAAATIASQAIISGVFSLTRQAVQLGYLPRINIVHTSSMAIGQIYVPVVGRILMVASVGLVFAFKSSTYLAAAYGVAVTITMLITTSLFFIVLREYWKWKLVKVVLLIGLLLTFNVAFCGAALLKIPYGGWFPLVVAAAVYTIMTTWRKGRQILWERVQQRVLPLEGFVTSIATAEPKPARVPGAAIFMSGNASGTPPVLLHNIKYNKVLHETVVVMTLVVEEVSHVEHPERISIEDLGHGFYRVRARYGFMESPNIKEVLELCAEQGLNINLATVGFFLGRENIRTTQNPGMATWRQKLFSVMSRNAQGSMPFYEIPPNQVVELGIQVQL